MSSEKFFESKVFYYILKKFPIFVYNLLVCSRVRQRLIEAGTNNIAVLPRIFKSAESFDGNSKISSSDFFVSLTKFGVNLRKEEAVVSQYL